MTEFMHLTVGDKNVKVVASTLDIPTHAWFSDHPGLWLELMGKLNQTVNDFLDHYREDHVSPGEGLSPVSTRLERALSSSLTRSDPGMAKFLDEPTGMGD